MGKNKNNSLGRSLIKDRFGNKHKKNTDSFVSICQSYLTFYQTYFHLKCFFQLHTSELKDGYDWNKFNLQSVTEQNSLHEFLSTAELAGTEFTVGIILLILVLLCYVEMLL